MPAPAEIVDIDDPRWQTFVAGSRDALAFHHPAWALLLSECYDFPAFAFVSLDANDRIDAGIPVLKVRKPFRAPRWIALPFTDSCPPLATDSRRLSSLVGHLDVARAAAGVAQLDVRAALHHPSATCYGTAFRHTLDLSPDPDKVFRTFKRSQVQQCIARAEREGVVIRRAESRADLVRYFYRLHVSTRRRLGVPVQPRRFFELLWARMLEPELGFALLAFVGGEPAAGAVFLTSANTTTYKFSASDPRFWSSRPNNLVLWTAIRWSCEHGRRTFDFGRTELKHQGLRDFKLGWGTHEHPLLYSSLGAPVAAAAGSGRASRAATTLIQRSPPWLCRGLGNAFYRYAA